MSEFKNKPNPDNRSDNVAKLQSMIQNTEENIRKVEIGMEFLGPNQQKQIKEKNKRREESIHAFREELKDEAHKNE